MTGYGKVKALEEKKTKDQLLHPWSCYRNEDGEIVLVYCIIDHSIAITGITKQQIDSLREELKSFELLDMELNQSLTQEEKDDDSMALPKIP